MRDSERYETQYGYYTIGEYDARQETDDLGWKRDMEEKLSFKEYILAFSNNLWQKHPASIIGVLAGIILAICILIFGFFNMLFVIICGTIGLFIGINVDKEGNWWRNILRCMPDDWHRWR